MDFNSYCNIAAIASKLLAIFYAVMGFCFLIVIHELGHFLFCKLFGVHTPTFSVGLGPKIYEKKIGDTNFCLSAIPLGGYCEVAGLVEVAQGEQEFASVEDETSFKTKTYWQKFLILMGGILFNIIFAYMAFIISFMIGKPKSDIVIIKSVSENSLAQKSGINKNDKIIRMGDSNINKSTNLLFKEIQNIQKLENVEYAITVERDGLEKIIKIQFPKIEKGNAKGRLGIEFDFQPSKETEKLSFTQAITEGIKATHEWIFFTFYAIKNIFAQRTVRGAGPVMIISESVKKAQQGFIYLLIFLAIISINLAIFNLLPFPILDGGQLLFATIERITGREIASQIKIIIFVASWALILIAFLFFTYNDIKTLLGF